MLKICWFSLLLFFVGCNEKYISKKREGLRPYTNDQDYAPKEAQESREVKDIND
jgi:hypothetical protein